MTSLLQPHTDISMRPTSDKEVVDLDDLFEQYLETDLIQFSENTVEPSGSDDLAHLFELPTSNESDPIDTSSMPDWDATEDAWHKALQNLEQNPASLTMPSNSFSIYPESRGKASLSDPEFFSFDDLFQLDQAEPRSSLSAPSTPKPYIARPAKKANSNPDRSTRNGIQKATKKSSTFSKMMRPSHFRAGTQDLWTRKLDGVADTFNLQLPSNGPLSTPPSSTKLMQAENSNGFFPRDQPYTIAMSPLPGEETSDMHQSNYQLTPLSSPAIDTSSCNGTGNPFQFSNDNMATAYISHLSSNAALSALHTPPPTQRLPIGTWGPDTPASLDFTYVGSSEFQALQAEEKTHGWWNNGSSAAPQPSTPTYHTPQPRSQNASMNFSTAPVAGLGISCDTAPFSPFESDNGVGSNGHGTTNGFGGSASSFDMSYTANAAHFYPQAPTNGIPIGAPRTSTPPSRSPSATPSLQPHFTRRRHSSHNHTSRSHRRKSSNSSNHSHGGQKSASVGFVNFTPHDSRKILTGVAPSGSSKTKARREKEAADKRRKLSQAAVKAVMEAGGDLRQLEEDGLLTMGVE